MWPNRTNAQRWFAWYPVWTNRGPRWLTEVWWYVIESYRSSGTGFYAVRLNRYDAR